MIEKANMPRRYNNCQYALNFEIPKYIKLSELKGEIRHSSLIIGGFNTTLSTMDTSSRESIWE